MTHFLSNETTRGIVFKLGILSSVAIGIFLIGKKHIAIDREIKHIERINEEENFVEAKEKLYSDDLDRESKYVGVGPSYANRKHGDRFNILDLISRRN